MAAWRGDTQIARGLVCYRLASIGRCGFGELVESGFDSQNLDLGTALRCLAVGLR
jgi:hypothetical protein